MVYERAEAHLKVARIVDDGQIVWPCQVELHVQGRVTCPVLLSALGMYWLALTMDCRVKCWERTVMGIIETSKLDPEERQSREEVRP